MLNKTKLTATLLSVTCIIGLAGYFTFNDEPSTLNREYCAFDDPQVLERQKFYQDDLVLALYTHRPVFPGHCLVIPKRHVERFEGLTEAEVTRIAQVIKRVDQAVRKVYGNTDYLLLQKNGAQAGQSVPHVHFHYIPRKTGFFSFFFNMYWSTLGEPISKEEMRTAVENIGSAMTEHDNPS